MVQLTCFPNLFSRGLSPYFSEEEEENSLSLSLSLSLIFILGYFVFMLPANESRADDSLTNGCVNRRDV